MRPAHLAKPWGEARCRRSNLARARHYHPIRWSPAPVAECPGGVLGHHPGKIVDDGGNYVDNSVDGGMPGV
jgi:hypothetical protein